MKKLPIPKIIIIIVAVALLGGIAYAGYATNKNAKAPAAVTKETSKPILVDGKEIPPSTNNTKTRDAARQANAAQIASKLFNIALVQRQTVPAGQAGLDMLTVSEGQPTTNDPTTAKPYVFNDNQTTMKVGEAYFKVGGTCDDKLKGSTGKGLIIDSAVANALAINIKLEAGGYACESTL